MVLEDASYENSLYLPPNQLDVAWSALNLGCDYVRHGQHVATVTLLQEALVIRWNYGGDDYCNTTIASTQH